MAIDFPQKLRELRKQHHISQHELAKAVSVHQTAVSQWETGRTLPDVETVSNIARFFDVPVDELLGNEGNKKDPAGDRVIDEIDENELRFALFGGEVGEITDEMFEEVKQFARFVATREKERKNRVETKDS